MRCPLPVVPSTRRLLTAVALGLTVSAWTGFTGAVSGCDSPRQTRTPIEPTTRPSDPLIPGPRLDPGGQPSLGLPGHHGLLVDAGLDGSPMKTAPGEAPASSQAGGSGLQSDPMITPEALPEVTVGVEDATDAPVAPEGTAADTPTPPPGAAYRLLAPLRGDALTAASRPLPDVLDELRALRNRPDAATQAAGRATDGAPEAATPGGPAGGPGAGPGSETREPALAAQQLYAYAEHLLRSGEPLRASRQLAAALRLMPDSPGLLDAAATASEQAGNRRAAVGLLSRRLSQTPNDASLLARLGVLLIREGQVPAGAATLVAALDLGPQDGEPLSPGLAARTRFTLASALVQMNQLAAAAELIQRFLKTDTSSLGRENPGLEVRALLAQRERHFNTLGNLFSRLDRPQEAASYYRQAIGVIGGESAPRALGVLPALAYAELRAGRPDEAARLTLEFAGRQAPPVAVLHLQWANLQGLHDPRIAEAIDRIYVPGAVTQELALARVAGMRPEAATEFLRGHLSLNPDHDRAEVLLLRLLLAGDEAAHAEALDRVMDRWQEVLAPAPPRGADPGPAAGVDAEPVGLDLVTGTDQRGAVSRAVAQRTLSLLTAPGDAEVRPAEAVVRALAVRGAAEPNPEAQAAAAAEAAALLKTTLEQLQSGGAGATSAMPEFLQAVRGHLASALLDSGERAQALDLLDDLPADRLDPQGAAVLAELLLEAGRADEALETTRTARRNLEAADAVQLVTIESRALEASGDAAAAEQVLNAAIASSPRSEGLYEAMLDLFDRQPSMGERYVPFVRRMLQQIPQSRIARLEFATNALLRGRVAQAAELSAGLSRDFPADSRVRLLAFEVLDKRGDVEAATRVLTALLDEARAADQIDPDLFRSAAAFLRRTGQTQQFLELHRQWFARGRIDARQVRQLAMALIQGDASEEAFRLLMEHWGTFDAGARNSGWQLVRASLNGLDHEDAARLLREAGTNHPGRADRLRLEEAVHAFLKDRASEAYAAASALILEAPADAPLLAREHRPIRDGGGPPDPSADPTLPMARELAVRVLDRLPVQEAIQAEAELTAHRPELEPELVNQLSRALDAAGRADEATRRVDDTLMRFPDDANLNNTSAYRLAVAGLDLDEAERRVRVALKSRPDSAAFLDTLGWVYYKQAKFEAAGHALERAVAADSTGYPVLLDHLADLRYRQGDVPRAVQLWQEARRRLETLQQRDDEALREDPELADLDARLEAKLQSAQADPPGDVPVPPLGIGVRAEGP